jgi:hypothetical protein
MSVEEVQNKPTPEPDSATSSTTPKKPPEKSPVKSPQKSPQKSRKLHSKAEKELPKDTLETGRKLIKQFVRSKYWGLYFDIFLLFGVSISYGIVLYFLIELLGLVYLVFAIICCLLISVVHYIDMKKDIDIALKDLELIMK